MNNIENPAYAVVLITTPDAATAQRIARRLLEQRKAACVNVISGVDSLFWWHDRLDSARECLMIVKTKASQIPDIVRLVKQEHGYTVPEVIALPVIGGNADYLAWIEKEVKP